MGSISPKELIVESEYLGTLIPYIEDLVLDIAKGSTNTIVEENKITIEFWADGYPKQPDSEDVEFLKEKLRSINLDNFYIIDMKEPQP